MPAPELKAWTSASLGNELYAHTGKKWFVEDIPYKVKGKSSNKHVQLICPDCNKKFASSIRSLFAGRGCPACKEKVLYSNRKQINLRLDPEYTKKLSEIVEYWSFRGEFEFMDFNANQADLKSDVSFSKFIMESAIKALHADLRNQERIDALATWIHEEKEDDAECPEVMTLCYEYATQEWGEEEAALFFGTLWPLALSREEEENAIKNVDPELLYQKKLLDAFNEKANKAKHSQSPSTKE